MSASIEPLIQAVQVPNANTSMFTAFGNTRIDAVTLYNPIGNAAVLVTLSIVPAGDTPGAGDQAWSQNCLPGVTYSATGLIGQALGPGDQIYAVAAVAALVNLFASGLVTS